MQVLVEHLHFFVGADVGIAPYIRHASITHTNCVHGSISGGKEVKAISLPVWG